MAKRKDRKAKNTNGIDPSFTPSPYTIENFLGMGGLASVYKVGENTAAKLTEIVEMYVSDRKDLVVRPVQAKILLGGILEVDDSYTTQLDADQLRRCRQAANEARILSKVRNIEHIVQLQNSYFIDHSGILSYIVNLDYLSGENLFSYLDMDEGEEVNLQHAQLRDAAKAIADIAGILPILAKKGIVHRDIKPSNIMYTPAQAPGEGKATLIDFGLAIDNDEYFSREQIFGTPGYLSPEQAKAEKLDTSSDIFSLGLTALRTYIGIQPFSIHRGKERGKKLHEVLAPLAKYDDAKKKEILAQVGERKILPEDLVSAIGMAIHEDPRQRDAGPLRRESELLAVGCYGLYEISST